ncbi:MAG: DUF1501 domain-containing protein [Verrucomicrobia bacterium]|jgi:hypothetical protein|nr:DUF1501 domain-containing protein [Verrucomicrobiota bacterium]MBT5063046.1 DUF1501 domain-containing protein [Verrucomicrobiota bacterium]MBT5480822.1 DUF1501 domain-containing protein [Verrucomicrobiota bacterium]MBT6239807.1 DUF1501 domain-containing protein [Verrucomicrobiota bacterium]MBT6805747.1 DUF1501 domain-containing protein [Verrucomicrobiota bacterium]
MSRTTINCEGITRRDFLQIGLGGTMGLGLCDLLRLQANTQGKNQKGSKTKCILVWLDGGPSHYETFDPKPDAPSGIRGEFKSIPTSVPGIHFSEVVPNLAKVMDKSTIIRSICHKDPNHGGGNHYMMTGAPTPVPVACGAFVTFHPSYGSMISYERGIRGGLPAYMSLPRMSRSGGPNFLGGQHAPFVIGGDPNGESFRVRDVVLPKSISESRAKNRRELREQLDRLKRIQDPLAADPTITFDQFYEQGVDLVTSPQAQSAFDIHQESDTIRDQYGRNDLGQRLLMARRLTEVGVSFVTVYYGGWDNHTNLFSRFKGSFMSKLDQGLASLIKDLHDRGSAENTMVICLGEFGRTPKINKDAGRDHWPHAMSVLMSGAGIPGGQIVGATDARGFYASDNVYSPEDFAASLYTKMGIDPTQTLYQSTGRPIRLVNGGSPIKELFT